MFSLRAWFGKILCATAVAVFTVTASGADSSSVAATKEPSTKPAAASAHKKTAHHRRKTHRVASWRRGQQKIQPDRAREIQDALVREHYLKGQPSGVWDNATQAAMQRYQADHGWQTKVIPDSRALIGLGLGPDHEHLLNPESAMTTTPKSVSADSDSDPGKAAGAAPGASAPAADPGPASQTTPADAAHP